VYWETRSRHSSKGLSGSGHKCIAKRVSSCSQLFMLSSIEPSEDVLSSDGDAWQQGGVSTILLGLVHRTEGWVSLGGECMTNDSADLLMHNQDHSKNDAKFLDIETEGMAAFSALFTPAFGKNDSRKTTFGGRVPREFLDAPKTVNRFVTLVGKEDRRIKYCLYLRQNRTYSLIRFKRVSRDYRRSEEGGVSTEQNSFTLSLLPLRCMIQWGGLILMTWLIESTGSSQICIFYSYYFTAPR
jgi:hypothetical protein